MKKKFFTILAIDSMLFLVCPIIFEAYHGYCMGSVFLSGFLVWFVSVIFLIEKIHRYEKMQDLQNELYASAQASKWNKARERQNHFNEMFFVSRPHSFCLTNKEIEEIANAF